MRNDHDRNADRPVQRAEQIQHLIGGLRVQRARRLVSQQQLRLVRERDGDRHPLLLAAGQLAELDSLTGGLALLLPAAPWRGPCVFCPSQQNRQLYILQRRQIRNEIARIILPYEADRLPLVFHQVLLAERQQILAIHQQLACGRLVQAAEHIQQGRLPAARIADDRHQLAVRDLQIQPLQSDDFEILPFCKFLRVHRIGSWAVTPLQASTPARSGSATSGSRESAGRLSASIRRWCKAAHNRLAYRRFRTAELVLCRERHFEQRHEQLADHVADQHADDNRRAGGEQLFADAASR